MGWKDDFAEITVLLTVYNRMSVKKTIDNIRKQTFQNYQLLIIDNASTDGTYELLKECSQKDGRIVVIQNSQNRGQTYSLNKGIKLAKGKYIARIDADDLMHPLRLQKQYEFLESHPDYGMCGSWVQFITDDDRLAFTIKTSTTDAGLRTMQRIACGVYHPAVMMRKSVLDQHNITYNSNLRMAEDYDMWRQILMYSKGLNLPAVLTYYRRGENNDSQKYREITHKEEYEVRHKICSYEKNYPGQKYMSSIFVLEQKDKKSICDTMEALKLYRKYVRSNIDKSEADYEIIMSRVKSRILGEFLIYNTAKWSVFVQEIYRIVRKFGYKFIYRRRKAG